MVAHCSDVRVKELLALFKMSRDLIGPALPPGFCGGNDQEDGGEGIQTPHYTHPVLSSALMEDISHFCQEGFCAALCTCCYRPVFVIIWSLLCDWHNLKGIFIQLPTARNRTA